ncbi:MAG: hypothetical protein JKY54_11200 [Flavobacteriales bacterium]|nr:hypothetical protein [Flavobacteriales bacterium]
MNSENPYLIHIVIQFQGMVSPFNNSSLKLSYSIAYQAHMANQPNIFATVKFNSGTFVIEIDTFRKSP